jgi:hypothetical protein
MKRQVVIGPATLALGIGLAVAAVVIAVLATVILTGGDDSTISAQPVLPTATSTAPPTTVPSPTSTPATAAAEISATSTATPAPPIQTATATPVVIIVRATAEPPAATAPPPQPAAPKPRYASVDAQPYWEQYEAADRALSQAGVATYAQALASPTWYPLTRAAHDALLGLAIFVGNLPYDDACRRALHDFGNTGARYLFGLLAAVKPPWAIPNPPPPTGQAGWNQAIASYQSSYYQELAAVGPACGP